MKAAEALPLPQVELAFPSSQATSFVGAVVSPVYIKNFLSACLEYKFLAAVSTGKVVKVTSVLFCNVITSCIIHYKPLLPKNICT